MGDPAVEKANRSLKAAGCAVMIELRHNRLSLRAHFPDKNNPSVHRQQRLSLGLELSRDGVKEAMSIAFKANAELEAGTFDWADYVADKSPQQSGLSPLQEFERYYFATRDDNPQTRTTFKNYMKALRKMPPGPPTEKAAQKLLLSYPAKSATRQQFHIALGFYMRFHKVPYDRDFWATLRGTYSSKGPEKREIPSDEEIEALWDSLDHPRAKLYVGMLATFGLRTSELFHVDNSQLLEGANFIVIDAKTKSKKERHAYAFPQRWIDRFELRQPWTLVAPPNRSNTSLGERISAFFRRHGLPHSYVFRHAYRLRTLKYGIDPVIASRSLGHSVAVGMEHYTRWMNEKDVSDAFDKDI